MEFDVHYHNRKRPKIAKNLTGPGGEPLTNELIPRLKGKTEEMFNWNKGTIHFDDSEQTYYVMLRVNTILTTYSRKSNLGTLITK